MSSPPSLPAETTPTYEDLGTTEIDRPRRAVRALTDANKRDEAIDYILSRSKEGKENVNLLLQAGVMPPLMNLLASGTRDTKNRAAWALESLLYSSGMVEAVHLAAGEEGAVEPLVGMLENEETAFSGVFCLRVLTGYEANRKRLLGCESTAKPSLEMMANRPALTDYAKKIAKAAGDVLERMKWRAGVRGMTHSPPSLPAKTTPCYQDLDSTEIVVRALSDANQLDEAIDYILDRSKEGKENVKLLVEAGVMPPLMNLLASGTSDLKNRAAWALDSLLYSSGMVEAAYLAAGKEGAVESLVGMLENGETAYSGVYCLRVLTANEANRKRLLGCESTAKPLLEMLANRPARTEDARDIAKAAGDVLERMKWRSGMTQIQLLSSCRTASTAMEASTSRSQSSYGEAQKLGLGHAIFLSHSGADKEFVVDLHGDLLDSSYNAFYDAESLPKGRIVTMSNILEEARNCRLAVMVLSDEFFVRNKNPMLELVACVEAEVQLLPLFYDLTVEQFKDKQRRRRWYEIWRQLEEEQESRLGDLDDSTLEDALKVNISKWEAALKILGDTNGIEYTKVATNKRKYRHYIVETIRGLVRPDVLHNGSR